MRVNEKILCNASYRGAWYVLENVSPLLKIKVMIDGGTPVSLLGLPRRRGLQALSLWWVLPGGV